MKNTFVQVLLATLLILVLGLAVSWYTADTPSAANDLPWTIEPTADGSIKIFHMHLGVSTLSDFITRYQEPPEISLFVPQHGDARIEAYFNSVWMAGLKAKIVLSLMVSKQDLDAMYDRGVRISTLEQGTRKVQLKGKDELQLNRAPIVSITYMPATTITDELLQHRFGEPSKKMKELVNGAEHWLYPEKGLDVVLSDKDKAVFQYIAPANFDRLMQPLTDKNNPSPTHP